MKLPAILEWIKFWDKRLKECQCPIFKGPCLKEKCWSFGEMKDQAWGEKVMVKDKKTGRVQERATGKVIIGTMYQCDQKVFPTMVIEARYALDTEAKWDAKQEAVTNPEGDPWEDADDVQIEQVDEGEKEGSLLDLDLDKE